MGRKKEVTNAQRQRPEILAQTIKTGIIKSNLVPMFAGLTLALYKYKISPFEKIPEILFAFIGSILIIGAAGAFNNLYDRDIDSIMERTKNRPTVTGDISPKTALWLGIFMTIFGLVFLALTTYLAAILGFIGLFLYVVPYTMWSKRRTIYNTEIGSVSGAMPPLIGWAAIYPDVTHPAIIGLFIIMIIWQMPHFYAIAIRKHKEYEAANVPMLPVVKGVKRTYIQTNVYLVILIIISILLGSLSIGLMLVSLLLSILWLALSIYGYKKMDSEKWAKSLFIFSLFHMTILFSTVIIYSLVGIFFGS
ncbi:heme o synthase [Bacillus cytotoxicus]|uniref:Protoheme IX farnesyltransferase 1 n=1 Tax=Bacillus cytotoxicus (strain DSM 22905 / CIP 110041 / 391-98 / NVH 391-98) TaxID=315749 RepID=COXX1_BACCN|nr:MULTISPECIES: heme o synthase [Bacillus cereus group]A7GNP0.1 RecName: Full=Protoheme IX farnesyltransferase 1; AltName: Full=Heme B farnesyltransferase 1; AltName: Full=Heme O synthase 1 [Bacillus cytotoxicus NVH 391-98]ABS21748.1 protoheme IX farnesyltransferase [Bacillus cytotoxicus NVH 391-98]AWC28362.1 protoheme IX farnesyltransferase 1 [Bacillus cytotoxicus]AWC32392.1 protoheme IX farnesyltransferase 1 [Bacillus cytotoxicus]AWC36421.1 protoheme IX farnesyltransferase 1 [Bacillus cytot